MSLDLIQVAAQIESMAATLEADAQDSERRLNYALEIINSQSADLDPLRKKVENAKTTWLVAGIADGLGEHCQPPPCPPDFAVIASDGSHIDVDRHSVARCCLINVGSVVLRYGQEPDAVLRSRPTLYAGHEELTIVDPLSSDEQRVEGALLGMKRAVSECLALAELAEEVPHQLPVLALLDGSLILWGLAGQAYPNYVKKELLDDGLLPALDKMHESSRKTDLAVASYVSATRSPEVVNALRVAICPHDPPDCDRHCPQSLPSSKRQCEVVAGVLDRSIFARLLKPGERSATFISRSSVVQKHYGKHEVHFFYLRTDDEVARVEFPRWVEERNLVGLLHTLVLDQCRRGHGYPVALSESHEQAVLNSADREQFQHLIELALTERRLPTETSAKSRSKRIRWI
ncbi:MAG: DNA double-strand break repair nuclease NurA [Dehalococcoidia bacterium]